MQIDHINLNSLRVFVAVYKSRSMTLAAKQLNLTQSGVSQHVRALEESLGVSLFDRLNKKLLPNNAADLLHQRSQKALFDIETALNNVTEADKITGTVHIGMPVEYGNNRVMPLLTRLGQKYENLHFNLTLDFASEMNRLLLAGEIDFAFIDQFQVDKRIHLEKVSEEQLDLVACKEYLKSVGPIKETKTYFESLNYIAYQHEEPVLRRWFSHHLRRKNIKLNTKVSVMDVQGVARFVVEGFGVGILPDHLVKKLIGQGHQLHIFKKKERPLKNSISLAYLKGKTLAPFVQVTKRDLISKLKS